MLCFVSLNYLTLSVPRKETESAEADGCGWVSLEAFTDDARLCLAPLGASTEGNDEDVHIPGKPLICSSLSTT